MAGNGLLFDTFADLTRYHAGVRPHHPALIFHGQITTYAELDRRASQVANGLMAFDPLPLSRLAYLGKNSDRFFEIYFGAAKARKIMAPLNWRLTVSELSFMLHDLTPQITFVDTEFRATLTELHAQDVPIGKIIVLDDPWAGGYAAWRGSQPENDPAIPVERDDAHVILYTSGTTGFPKGVMLTHRSEFAMRETEAGLDPSFWHPVPEDIVLCQLPCFHLSGSSWGFLWMYYGCTVVVQPQSRVEDILDAIRVHRINYVQFVPALLQSVLDHPRCLETDLTCLKMIFYGSAPFSPELLRRVLSTLHVDLFQMYGMTECSGCIVFMAPEVHRGENLDILRACGRAYPGIEMRVMNGDGMELSTGECGEICVRTPGLMKGYWLRPEATAEAMFGPYYRTGDAGYRDEQGYYYIVDRVKDMIVSGGENIYPAEIERVLRQHPGVREVAVIGVPDSQWGEAVKAVLITDDSTLDEEQVRSFSRRFLAGYKVPKTVSFVQELPRNAGGKVLKRALRDAYAASTAAAISEAPMPPGKSLE